MPTPIFRIKRNQTSSPLVPTTLAQAELAVDFANNKLYSGTGSSIVQLGTRISHDTTFSTLNDETIPTQLATKTYINANYTPGPPGTSPPKDVCNIRVLTWRPITGGQLGTSIDGNRFVFNSFFEPNIVVTQNPAFIEYGENQNIGQLNYSGLYQTTKNNMYLHVSYSVVYSPIDINLTPWPGIETQIEYWRSFGMRVLDVSTTYASDAVNPTITHYGVQFTPPVLGDSSLVSYPTLISGSAIVKLPKYRDIDGNRWELQFYSQARSAFPSLTLANYGNTQGASNIPGVPLDYRFKIHIVKLYED